jgi:hypothetical protein
MSLRPELARRFGVSLRVVAGFASGASTLMRLNHEAIRRTFEQAGVVFIGKNRVQLVDR